MTKSIIDQAVNKFLGWKLPKDFAPDAGISFKAEFNEHTQWPMKHEPVGTNLFTADQAKAMFEHCLGDAIAAIKAAHLAELTQGVEMPEADRHVGESKFEEWYASYERQGISKQVARDAYAAGMGEYCFTLDQCQQAVAAAMARKDAEIANLHTVMMAAAVEITEHWDAHCDDEGYGPANLVRRLENGYPEQYGYDAKTVVNLEAQRDALTAERDALRDELNKCVEAARAALKASK